MRKSNMTKYWEKDLDQRNLSIREKFINVMNAIENLARKTIQITIIKLSIPLESKKKPKPKFPKKSVNVKKEISAITKSIYIMTN